MSKVEQDSIRKLLTFQKEVLRLFKTIFTASDGSKTTGPVMENINYPIPVDIVETKDSVVVEIELPGVNKQDVKLSILQSSLIISGTKSKPATLQHHYFCIERHFGKFHRIIELPNFVSLSGVEASLENGLMSVTFKRLNDRRGQAREISVN